MDKALVEKKVKQLLEDINLPEDYRPVFSLPKSESIVPVEIVEVGEESIRYTMFKTWGRQLSDNIEWFLKQNVERVFYQHHRKPAGQTLPTLDADIKRFVEGLNDINTSSVENLVTELITYYELPKEHLPLFQHPGFRIDEKFKPDPFKTTPFLPEHGNWCRIRCAEVVDKKVRNISVELYVSNTGDVDQLLAWIIGCPRVQQYLVSSRASYDPSWKLIDLAGLAELKKEAVRLCQQLDIPLSSLPDFGGSEQEYFVRLGEGILSLVHTERGRVTSQRTTLYSKDILQWIMESATLREARSFELENRIPGQDSRILWMKKHVELLGELDSSWAEKAQKRYDKILSNTGTGTKTRDTY